MNPKNWRIRPAGESVVERLRQDLNIHPVLCRLLAVRGIDDFEKARAFFRPDLAALFDPFLMKDMPLAVDRILQAMEKKEKVLVFGDYDVDGTTSVAIMTLFLRSIYSPGLLDFYIPNRYKEGYGISKAGIDHAHSAGFSLIISVDCGIKSIDLVHYAATLGIDFIICDHHLPDDKLPEAVAILNPKQTNCNYPDKDLCGCGVAFKLITAICNRKGMPESVYHHYLDLVAIAIAADIVPIRGENRILAFHGLKKVNTDPNPGIRALMALSEMTSPVDIRSLVFMIAPRVNAAGRMDDARKAVLMFLASENAEAEFFGRQLHTDNAERREKDKLITGEALALIAGEPGFSERKTTVVYQPHWHKGVVGIVASRLIEKHYRPTVVLTRSGDLVAGSARSVEGFNLYEAIHACREALIAYGGHFAAAGLSMEPAQVPVFSILFEEQVAATIHPDSLIREITIDAEVSATDLTFPFFRIIHQMEPFGPDNTDPVFVLRSVRDTGQSKLLKDKHVRLVLEQNGMPVPVVMGFDQAEKWPLPEGPFDIVFSIKENEWNGNKSLQLRLIDLRAAEALLPVTVVKY